MFTTADITSGSLVSVLPILLNFKTFLEKNHSKNVKLKSKVTPSLDCSLPFFFLTFTSAGQTVAQKEKVNQETGRNVFKNVAGSVFMKQWHTKHAHSLFYVNFVATGAQRSWKHVGIRRNTLSIGKRITILHQN